jgi:GNAT superfamily N-acetyltransferase
MDLNEVDIVMVRDTLSDVPAWDLAEGFSFRCYRGGDMDKWLDIERQADPHNILDPGKFESTFSSRLDLLDRRMLFICDEHGRDVATSTAWYEDQQTGLVHWVAVIPALQGRGLAKPLLSHTLNRLAALGHKNAMLRTQIFRLPAINLYIKAGFRPRVSSQQHEQCWRHVSGKFRSKGLDAKVIDDALTR